MSSKNFPIYLAQRHRGDSSPPIHLPVYGLSISYAFHGRTIMPHKGLIPPLNQPGYVDMGNPGFCTLNFLEEIRGRSLEPMGRKT